jgi:hypothetical protein
MKNLKSLYRDALNLRIIHWLLIFLVMNIISRGTGGTNSLSRFAMMRSMTEQGSFKIDTYQKWTHDWAQTPDGHFYSNKAPGPMFLGLPFFFLIEQVTKFDKKEVFSSEGYRLRPVGPSIQMVISLLTQVIPFLLLVILIIRWLENHGVSYQARQFAVLALLFGNTVAGLMNSFFGHGLAAIFLLLTLWSLCEKRYFWLGLSFGLALLCDYGSAFLLIPLLFLLLWQNKRDFKWALPFVVGGLIPGLFWGWYHISAFGSPFIIAAKYQNPMWQDVKVEGQNIWGIFHFNLPINIFKELLVGTKRGLLFTQPWILIYLLGMAIIPKRFFNKTSIFSLSGLILLLMMNVSFGGWHGGWTFGPRYLSIIFLCMAVSTAFHFDHFPVWFQRLLWLGLGVSLLYHGLVYGTGRLIPEGYNVWPYMLNKLTSLEDKKHLLKFSVYILLMSFGFYKVFRKNISLSKNN